MTNSLFRGSLILAAVGVLLVVATGIVEQSQHDHLSPKLLTQVIQNDYNDIIMLGLHDTDTAIA